MRQDLNCSYHSEKNDTCDEDSVMQFERELHVLTTESDNGKKWIHNRVKVYLQYVSTPAWVLKAKDIKYCSVESKLHFMSCEDI